MILVFRSCIFKRYEETLPPKMHMLRLIMQWPAREVVMIDYADDVMFSTIAHVDRIVVLKQGKIVEVGSKEELLAKKGVFYELFSLQML